MRDCRIDWSVDTGAAACLADIASHRTASGAQSRSDHQGARRQAATARPWGPEPRIAAPPSDFGGGVRERRSFFRSRRSAEERLDLGAAVARSHPYRLHLRGRVRIRRPALSVAYRDCRADHRGTLVGATGLWSRQASAFILIAEASQ